MATRIRSPQGQSRSETMLSRSCSQLLLVGLLLFVAVASSGVGVEAAQDGTAFSSTGAGSSACTNSTCSWGVEWSSCQLDSSVSGSCGPGYQQGDLTCLGATGAVRTYSDCLGLGLTKPSQSQSCDDLHCLAWLYLSWDQVSCSVACLGVGTQTRELACYDSTSVANVSTSLCYARSSLLPAPNTTQTCYNAVCSKDALLNQLTITQGTAQQSFAPAFQPTSSGPYTRTLQVGLRTILRIVTNSTYAKLAVSGVSFGNRSGEVAIAGAVNSTTAIAINVTAASGAIQHYSLLITWAVSTNPYLERIDMVYTATHPLDSYGNYLNSYSDLIDPVTDRYEGGYLLNATAAPYIAAYNQPWEFAQLFTYLIVLPWYVTSLQPNLTTQSSYSTASPSTFSTGELSMEGDPVTKTVVVQPASGSSVSYSLSFVRSAPPFLGITLKCVTTAGSDEYTYATPEYDASIDNEYALTLPTGVSEAWLTVEVNARYLTAPFGGVIGWAIGYSDDNTDLWGFDTSTIVALTSGTPQNISGIPSGTTQLFIVAMPADCDSSSPCLQWQPESYLYTITKLSSDASLSALSFYPLPASQDPQTFDGTCDSKGACVDFYATWPYDLSSTAVVTGITFLPESDASDMSILFQYWRASSSVDGDADLTYTDIQSETDPFPLATSWLDVGYNVVHLTLTSEDGTLTVLYQIYLIRLAPVASSSSTAGAEGSNTTSSSTGSSTAAVTAAGSSSTAAQMSNSSTSSTGTAQSSTGGDSSFHISSTGAGTGSINSTGASTSTGTDSSGTTNSSSSSSSTGSSMSASTGSSTGTGTGTGTGAVSTGITTNNSGSSTSSSSNSNTTFHSASSSSGVSASSWSSSTGVGSSSGAASPDTKTITVSSSGVAESSTGASFVEPIANIVTVAASVDPCTTDANPCQNGAQCRSALSNGSTNTAAAASDANQNTVTKSMVCTCTTGFWGPTCSVGMVGCVVCASSLSGNKTMSIAMVGASSLTDALIGGVTVFSTLAGVTVATTDARVASIIATHSNSAVRALAQVDLVTFTSRPIITASIDTSAITYDALTFAVAPSASSSFAVVRSSRGVTRQLASTFVNPFDVQQPTVSLVAQFAPLCSSDSTGGLESLDYNSTMIYYSAGDCSAGTFQNGYGDCVSCPTGCQCVEGGRCWPLPGYWSSSIYTTPIQCTYADACPGYSAAAVTSESDSSAVDTQVCTTGYSGRGCSTCADNYYSLNSRCYSCGSSTDQTAQMVSILLAAGIVTGVLAVGVATLSAVQLVYLVTAVVMLQQVASIGAQGASSVPGSAGPALATFFSYISVVNFDLEILRPGCTVPSFNFVKLFLATLALVAFNAAMFACACTARLCILRARQRFGRRAGETEQRLFVTRRALDLAKTNPTKAAMQSDLFVLTPEEDFRRRLTHSLLILATIFYLKLCTLQMKLFQCQLAPPPMDALTFTPETVEHLYLSADFQTRCYTGEHLYTLIVSILLFIFFTGGAPFCAFVLLCRSFADDSTTGIVGWMRARMRILRPPLSRVEARKQAFINMNAEEAKRDEQVATASAAAAVAGSSTTAVTAFGASTPGAPPAQVAHSSDSRSGSSSSDDESSTSSMPTPRKPLAAGASSDAVCVTSESFGSSQQKLLSSLFIENEQIAYFGFLYLDIRSEVFAYRLSSFIVNFYIAVVSTFVATGFEQLFLLGIIFAAQAMTICWYLPFSHWLQNARAGGVALGLLAQNIVLLCVQSDSAGHAGPGSPYFITLVCIFALCGLVLVCRHSLFAAIARFTGLRVTLVGQRGEVRSKAAEIRAQEYADPAPAKGVSAIRRGADDEPEWSVTPDSSQRVLAWVDLAADHLAEEREAIAASELAKAAELERNLQLRRAQEAEAAAAAAAEAAMLLQATAKRALSPSVRSHSSKVAPEPAPLKIAPRERSTLPPSSSFPVKVSLTPAFAVVAMLLAGEGRDDAPNESNSELASPSGSRRRSLQPGLGWTSPKSTTSTSPSWPTTDSQQSVLTLLSANRSPEQVASLAAAWSLPEVAAVIEAQHADMTAVARDLRAQVMHLLDQEYEDACEAASSTGDGEKDPLPPRTCDVADDTIASMVAHLLAQTRPDLKRTLADHLLAHARDPDLVAALDQSSESELLHIWLLSRSIACVHAAARASRPEDIHSKHRYHAQAESLTAALAVTRNKIQAAAHSSPVVKPAASPVTPSALTIPLPPSPMKTSSIHPRAPTLSPPTSAEKARSTPRDPNSRTLLLSTAASRAKMVSPPIASGQDGHASGTAATMVGRFNHRMQSILALSAQQRAIDDGEESPNSISHVVSRTRAVSLAAPAQRRSSSIPDAAGLVSSSPPRHRTSHTTILDVARQMRARRLSSFQPLDLDANTSEPTS